MCTRTQVHDNKQTGHVSYGAELLLLTRRLKKKLQSQHALFLAGGSTFDITFGLLPCAPASQEGNVLFSSITSVLTTAACAATSQPWCGILSLFSPVQPPTLIAHRALPPRRAGGAFAASFAASMWVPLKFKIPGIECRVA